MKKEEKNDSTGTIAEVNFLSKGAKIKGECTFEHFTRIHGKIKGHVQGLPGSFIVIGEEACIEGDIHCDSITIDGVVMGNIFATGKVCVSGTGTLKGDVISKRIEICFGATFEGKTTTTHGDRTNPPHRKNPSPTSSLGKSPIHS